MGIVARCFYANMPVNANFLIINMKNLDQSLRRQQSNVPHCNNSFIRAELKFLS